MKSISIIKNGNLAIVAYVDDQHSIVATLKEDYTGRIGELVEDLLALGVEAISEGEFDEDFEFNVEAIS